MTHALPVLKDRSIHARELTRLVRGQVRFDLHNRLLYSTDASVYQAEPIGVVIPADIDDVAAVLVYCAKERLAVLPRGGGTSLAGQCTNRAVVVDLSAMCRRVLSVEAQRRRCVVEPGISINELNRELATRGTGLMFAPDPATVAQAAIGGCIGNNAAGARSIKYGRTSENVAALDVLLSTGERCRLTAGAGRDSQTALRLARQVAEVVSHHAELIRQRFPKLVRRNAGYGLDLVLQQLDSGVAVDDLDLSGLICGSEGTLAVVLGAELKLHPVPRTSGLAILSFPSLESAIAATPAIVATGATAVELIDEVVLEAAANNTQCRRYLELMPTVDRQLPKAVLYVEYQSAFDGMDGGDEIEERFSALRKTVPTAPMTGYRDAASMNDAWTLRKSGEALLHGLSGSRKPQTFVEDNSVPLENLGRFVDEFKKIVTRHGTTAAYWAHASVGVLHIRPMIDLHQSVDRQTMREIAVEVADLARECGGVMSGEHGDGRVRGPLLGRFYGPELMGAFAEVKRIFDPAGILNPGMIVGAGEVKSITESLRVDQGEAQPAAEKVDTYFDYGDQEDFRGAVEMCNGAGFCRKTTGGTMCPSYRATLDERHSTRGRGNALRLAISGQLGHGAAGDVWNDPGVIETLDLCLSCKACKTECPSNVDLARLKAEYTGQRYKRIGAPLAAKAFGHIRKLNQVGSIAPELANWIAEQPPVRALLEHMLGLARQRNLPAFAPSLYGWFRRRYQTKLEAAAPTVVLFADCFTTYNEPHIGQSAVRVMERLGYRVELPAVACCGRAMISTGLMDDAVATADRTLNLLRPYIEDHNVRAVVVCEPSCLSAIKDDWLQLKLSMPIALRKKLADKAMLPEEFVERFWGKHPRKIEPVRNAPDVILHGHCHQKALWGDGTSGDVLRRLTGGKVTVLPSGCCGMAGAFGYLKSKFDVSMRIGELSVFGPVRSASDATVIAAPGTSCRHQIRDGTGRDALHPIEIVEGLIAR